MGLMHIYCGDGKGKTTAALGLAIRAAGTGMKVHLVQFLKGTDTGELHSLSRLPNISVARCDRNYGFTFQMSEDERRQIIICHGKLLRDAWHKVHDNTINMLILDEFFSAYHNKLLDCEKADQLLLSKPKTIELVLTGRTPPTNYLTAADYVSEIHAVKHPYTSGISARKGIEY